MAVWPSSLPQTPLADGFAEAVVPNVVRSENDVGPTNARRRYTAAVRQFQMRLLLTSAQVVTLDTFYETTLVSGVLPFDWVNHRTGAALSYVFLSPMAYEEAGPDYWSVTLLLEGQL